MTCAQSHSRFSPILGHNWTIDQPVDDSLNQTPDLTHASLSREVADGRAAVLIGAI